MNEFTRKAMQIADLFENAGRRWASASPKNAYRVKEERDELRAALVAHLEGVQQKLQDPASVHVAMLRGEIAKPAIRDMLHAYGSEALAQFDRGEKTMDMALCEIHSVVIRPGQPYTFSRVGDCEKCAAMEREAFDAYGDPTNKPVGRYLLATPTEEKP